MIVRMCCVCHRIERGETWECAAVLSEDALISHGYCPDCFTGALAEVEELTGAMAVSDVAGTDWSTVRGHWGSCG